MFESLSNRLQSVFDTLRSRGKLTEKDIDKALKEVKLSLLEADVNFKVVKQFIKDIKEKTIGEEVFKSLTPGQQVIKIVHQELINMLGGETKPLNLDKEKFNCLMVAGLQGSGKTTSCAKMANYYKKKGFKPILSALDIYRPAAIKQLKTLGEQIGVEVFSMGDKTSPPDIAKAAHEYAVNNGYNLLILDTAGRLQIDEELMLELIKIKENISIDEILLVLDAMTGQEAVNVATIFNDQIELTGMILTKLDGDARGGAALSVSKVTGKPVRFVGLGEKTDEFDLFHPERMAGRILGMGDMLTLIEKAQKAFDEKQAKEMETKIRKMEFNLNDFLKQLQQIKKMGPLSQLMEMVPGFSKIKAMGNMNIDEKPLKKVEAIIQSMTLSERDNPKIINGSRKRRIATGSGSTVHEVNQLLKQFEQMKKMMKQMTGMEKKMKFRGMNMFKNMF